MAGLLDGIGGAVAGGLAVGAGTAIANQIAQEGQQERDKQRAELEHGYRVQEQQQKLEAEAPLRDAQAKQAGATAELYGNRAKVAGTLVTIDSRDGHQIQDPEATDVPPQYQIQMPMTDVGKYQSAQVAGRTRENVAATQAGAKVDAAKIYGYTRTDVAKIGAEARTGAAQISADARAQARQYAPTQIAKLRQERDALPDDSPDRAIYDNALSQLAKGKGVLTQAQIAGIKQRTVKDVQTATDARGKPLYATPEAQQAEVDRRLRFVLPEDEITGGGITPPASVKPATGRGVSAPAPDAPPAPAAAAAEPMPAAPREPVRSAPLAAPPAKQPPSGLTGAGTKAQPYVATDQQSVDWFKANAQPGQVIDVGGRLYTK